MDVINHEVTKNFFDLIGSVALKDKVKKINEDKFKQSRNIE